MEYIKGLLNELWAPYTEVVVTQKKKRKRVERISLRGRNTPIDLLEKASFRISNLEKATYSVNPDKSFLTVNLPKQRSKNKRKDYVMEYFPSIKELLNAISQEMLFDEFESMDSVRLAAEYPHFFWNGMLHTLGQITLLDTELKKQGLLLPRKRRRATLQLNK